MFEWIRQLLPNRQEVFLVFGMVLFAVHSWAIYNYLYMVPSFILRMGIGQMAAIFAYTMAFAFLESILVSVAILFVSILPPGRSGDSIFICKAFLMVVVGSVASINFMDSLAYSYEGINPLLYRFLAAAAIYFVLLLITYFVQPVQKMLLSLAGRISVMIYIYAPIGLLSLLVVILRNLF